MVKISYLPSFQKEISKIKDSRVKERILKQIEKIVNNPGVGKPMKHWRKGTREVKIPPFRLSYAYNSKEDVIEILDFYHKDKQ
jgi:mRNA-degrading endonuclease RelE of RelBE toxin-antitoxin system